MKKYQLIVLILITSLLGCAQIEFQNSPFTNELNKIQSLKLGDLYTQTWEDGLYVAKRSGANCTGNWDGEIKTITSNSLKNLTDYKVIATYGPYTRENTHIFIFTVNEKGIIIKIWQDILPN